MARLKTSEVISVMKSCQELGAHDWDFAESGRMPADQSLTVHHCMRCPAVRLDVTNTKTGEHVYTGTFVRRDNPHQR